VQRIIKRDGVLDNVKAMGRCLEFELRQQLSRLPYVGDIRGRGLFWAVEFIRNTTTKTPFPREHNFSNRIVEVAAKLGLNVLGNLGKTGELDVELVIISPPYIVSRAEVKSIVDLLKHAIEIVTEEYELQNCRPGKSAYGLIEGRL
jgi:adenosylmethionine-8-amino-7-oxononanoate aminotransferase